MSSLNGVPEDNIHWQLPTSTTTPFSSGGSILHAAPGILENSIDASNSVNFHMHDAETEGWTPGATTAANTTIVKTDVALSARPPDPRRHMEPRPTSRKRMHALGTTSVVDIHSPRNSGSLRTQTFPISGGATGAGAAASGVDAMERVPLTVREKVGALSVSDRNALVSRVVKAMLADADPC